MQTDTAANYEDVLAQHVATGALTKIVCPKLANSYDAGDDSFDAPLVQWCADKGLTIYRPYGRPDVALPVNPNTVIFNFYDEGFTATVAELYFSEPNVAAECARSVC